jgi:hypothetical protein
MQAPDNLQDALPGTSRGLRGPESWSSEVSDVLALGMDVGSSHVEGQLEQGKVGLTTVSKAGSPSHSAVQLQHNAN